MCIHLWYSQNNFAEAYYAYKDLTCRRLPEDCPQPAEVGYSYIIRLIPRKHFKKGDLSYRTNGVTPRCSASGNPSGRRFGTDY